MFDRGWTDGLPVVPPTEARVLRMLTGTTGPRRRSSRSCRPTSSRHRREGGDQRGDGRLPARVPAVGAGRGRGGVHRRVQHPRRARHDDAGRAGDRLQRAGHPRDRHELPACNVLGQGNRANSTIGRALQLVIRNVGGGRPGEVDRATHGNPGKIGVLLRRGRGRSPWASLAVERGIPAGTDAVTLFPGEGPRCVVDQLSREPESLARSFAACLRTLHHPKLVARLRRDPGRRPRARPGLRRGRLGTRARCWPGSARELQIARRRARARRRRHRRGHARGVRRRDRAAEVPRPAACCSCTPAAAPGCSRRSSAAGPTVRSGATPVDTSRCNTDAPHGPASSSIPPASARSATRERAAPAPRRSTA